MSRLRPVLCRLGCGVESREQSCEHRGFRPVRSRTPSVLRSGGGDGIDRLPRGQGHEGCLLPDTDDIPRRRRVLVLEVTQAASEVTP